MIHRSWPSRPQILVAERHGLPGTPPSSATYRPYHRSERTGHAAVERKKNAAVAKTRQHHITQVSVRHSPALRAIRLQPPRLRSARDQRDVFTRATAAPSRFLPRQITNSDWQLCPVNAGPPGVALGAGYVEVSTHPAPALLSANRPLQFQVRPLHPGLHGKLRYGTAGTAGAVVSPNGAAPRCRCTRRCIHDVSSGVRIAVTITDAATCTVASGAIAA